MRDARLTGLWYARRDMRGSADVERFRIARSFPSAEGKVRIRVQAVCAPGRAEEEGVLRALFRVRPADGGKERIVAALGASVEGRPALLEGEALLPAGLHEIRPARGKARGMRFLVQEKEAPLRVLCRHRTARPSWSEFAAVLSPLQKPLGGILETWKGACCRREVLQFMARSENPFELTLIQPLGGSLRMRFADGVRAVRRGEYLLVDPALPSRLDAATPFPLHYRAIVFTQEMLRSARERLGLEKGMGAFGFDPSPRPMTPLLDAAFGSFRKAAFRTGALGGDWDALLALQRLLLLLLDSHPNRLKVLWKARVLGEPRDARVRTAARYLRDHLADPFDARAVGRAASVSAPHLRQLFRRELGLSPVAFLQRLRIEAAKRLLGEGDAKVEAVARAVGYTDMASLRRLFRRHALSAPRSFR